MGFCKHFFSCCRSCDARKILDEIILMENEGEFAHFILRISALFLFDFGAFNGIPSNIFFDKARI